MSIKEKLGDKIYNDMLDNACAVKGNSAPIKRAFSKDVIKIAFTGGSVTYGYFPSGEPCSMGYESNFEKMLKDKFPTKKFEFLNLGISGTACLMGLFLSEYKIIAFAPDIIFVEYALNENNSPEGIERYESLLRKLIGFDNSPAVIPISALSRSGYSCEEYTNALAQHYNIFAMGLKNALTPILQNNKLEWSEYSCDEGHPTIDGHILIADCLMRLIDIALICDKNYNSESNSVMVSNRLESLKLLDFKSLNNIKPSDKNCFSFEDCVEICGDVFFEIGCKCLAVVFIASNSESFTDCTVTIDGDEVCTLQGYSIFGWNNPISQMIFSSDEKNQHTVKISPIEKSKHFVLCAIGFI